MLIRSVSGVRGYVNSHFTPEISINYARALNEILPEGVIIAGRDSRASGEFIMIEMINEFNSLEAKIINIDLKNGLLRYLKLILSVYKICKRYKFISLILLLSISYS